MALTIVLSNRTVDLPEEPIKDEKAASKEWLENWAKENGMKPKETKNCGTCHYFRKLNNQKEFAADEGQCWEPRQGERDTKSASQTCRDWAAREPERLAMPPSKKRKRKPSRYAFRPEGGQGHGWLRNRRADHAY